MEIATVPHLDHPALSDILGYLEVARRAYGVEGNDSQHSQTAAQLIEFSAVQAHKERAAFTREYVANDFDKLGVRIEIQRFACAFVRDLTDADIISYGELIGAIEWVCQRINELTGIPLSEIRDVMKRREEDKPLDFQYGETWTSLNHVGVKLRELDSDGTTKQIWHQVLRRSSVIRKAFASQAKAPPPAKRGAGQPFGEQISLTAQAIAFVIDREKATGRRPKWSEVLAAVPGTSKPTLSRDPNFKAAWNLAKSQQVTIPKGTKTQSGIEAEYEDSPVEDRLTD
jgi:hypothetical protein